METLTKENFWNEMEQKYPKAMAHFKAWIDKYKKENHWITLFCAMGDMEGEEPEYHELPIAMQFGIFLEYHFDFIKDHYPHYQPGPPNKPKEFINRSLGLIQHLL